MKNIHTELIFLFLLVIGSSANGQIYNYDPIRHTNFEINPAYLATDKYRFTSSAIHQGNSSASTKFYQDALKFSGKLQTEFLLKRIIFDFIK